MILLSRLLMLIIVVALLVFCMSNLDAVTVRFVGWESPNMPLFLVLLFVFFFGFFLALFWQALRSVTMKREFKPAPVIPRAPQRPGIEAAAKKEQDEGQDKKEKKTSRWWGKKSTAPAADDAKNGPDQPAEAPAAKEDDKTDADKQGERAPDTEPR